MPPFVHDELRVQPCAYDLALRGLKILLEAGANCAVLHTATTTSLPHLRDLAERVAAVGASVLQVHPLEIVGRAGETMPSAATEVLPSRAVLLARLIERDIPVEIHVDAVSRAEIEMLVDSLSFEDEAASLPSPLVIEPDGWVVPWTYGMPRHLSLGRLDEGTLTTMAKTFVVERRHALR